MDRNVLKQEFGLFIRSMKTKRKSLEETGTEIYILERLVALQSGVISWKDTS